jgi:hypothetical protein
MIKIILEIINNIGLKQKNCLGGMIMKGIVKKCFYILFVFFIFQNYPLAAVLNFSHQHATVTLNSGAKLILDNSITNWNGTLIKDTTANISGENINFNEGILQSGTSQGLMTGLYDTTGPDKILLQGNGRFNAEPGTIIHEIQISGANNKLEGQPLFSFPILFDGSPSTVLSIAIQSKLNQNIQLNSGTLYLNDDLRLADDVKIEGTGTIVLNNNTLHLPGKQSSWTDNLSFKNAMEIALHAKTLLTATWTFEENGRINGNGNILDLSGDGKISINSGVTLYLTDIYLKGINSNSFEFGNKNTQINMTNVDVEIVSDVQLNTGGIYIDGTSTFILREHDWTFDQNASLSVDGTTLWLDTDISNPGELKVPRAIYENHIWQPQNEIYNIASGKLSLINTGTIKEIGTGIGTGSVIVYPCPDDEGTCATLTAGPLTSDITLNRSCHIHPGQRIRISENLTIDGNGATLIFSHPDHSQFIIDPGKTLTLKNIELARLNESTFDLRVQQIKLDAIESQLNIAENVVFEMSENITFSQGIINLVNESANDANVFFVRGTGGKKVLSFILNKDAYPPKYNNHEWDKLPKDHLDYKTILNLGQNTLALQNVEIREGLDNVSFSTGNIYVGAIGLVGEATINIGDPNIAFSEHDKQNGQYEECDLVFITQGPNNKLMLKKNDLLFTGQILFADEGDNTLHMDFVLTEKIGTNLERGIPVVNFGNGCVKLTSYDGIGRLIFDDMVVRVNNESNGFVAWENSFLGAKHLIISGDPIWDLYDPESGEKPFIIEAEELTAQGLDSAIVSAYNYLSKKTPVKHSAPKKLLKTALHVLYEQDKKQKTPHKPAEQNKEQQSSGKNKTTSKLKANSNNNNKQKITTRYFDETVKVNRYESINKLKLGNASGNILLYQTNAVNFFIASDAGLNLLLAGENTLNLDVQDTELKTNDTIAIEGSSNTIKITKKLTINGTLSFEQNSELTFEFDENANTPEIYFAANANKILSLKPYARLSFKGRGTVTFGDGFKINLKGTTTTDKPTLVFSDSANLSLVNKSASLIYGNGKILVDNGGQIKIGANQHLVIGNSNEDNIDILVDRAAAIRVDSLKHYALNQQTAKISIQQATCSLDFEQGGMLSIGKGGLLEINALENQSMPGILTSFKFDQNGILNIDNGGILRLGPNRYLGPRHTELSFAWDNLGGQVTGTGIIQFVATEFAGQLQDLLLASTNLTAEGFVKQFIGTVPNLSVSTVFIDKDGQNKIRMKNGKIFNLYKDDIINEDDSKTGFAYGSNNGLPFILKLDGSRS